MVSMPAPDAVLRLIDRFARHRESLRGPGYNETSIRREYIDPLFAALGWDIDNRQGHAEAYKNVAPYPDVSRKVQQLLYAKARPATVPVRRECQTLITQIDELVYRLYGLTDTGIGIVEDAST